MNKKSTEVFSSVASSSDVEVHFSHKRYFINNLDSYHGSHILHDVSKVLERNNASTKDTSQSMLGEDLGPASPPPPELPYEIIGTVLNENAKSIDHVSRIIPAAECIPVMLTCGTVILDVSYDREQLRIATEYIKVLKELLEKQAPPPKPSGDPDDATTTATGGSIGENKKRYLILISTVMTWACTKPLDPVRST
ncbi:unnamed protein product [Chrysodeixis includens]|uniref:Uncharacterized protein n=1 Tax=Chrysodeixis includens TaxID=689277 RepID=A0A9P0FWN3_CHRIL|nr:unnamed protein product [Chrysodeixis includens]